MSGNHINTAMHNVEYLEINCHLTKCGNRALFKQGSQFYISPAVAKNSQGDYWFDIREATLNYITKDNLNHCKVIIRIIPDLFIYLKWVELKALLENFKEEKTGLVKWEFLLQNNFTVVKNKNSTAKLSVYPLNRQEFLNKFKNDHTVD